MTDEQKKQVKQEKAPEFKRPDEAIKDLDPDMAESAAVKGGDGADYITVNCGTGMSK